MGNKSLGGAGSGAVSGGLIGNAVGGPVGGAIGAGVGGLAGSGSGKKGGGSSEAAAKNIAEEQLRMQRALLNPTLDTASMRTSLMSQLLGDIQNYTQAGIRANTGLIPLYEQLAKQQIGMQDLFNQQSRDFALKAAPLRTLAFGELQSMLEGRGNTAYDEALRGGLERSGELMRSGLAASGELMRGGLEQSRQLLRGGLEQAGQEVRQGLGTSGELMRGALGRAGAYARAAY